MAESILPSWLDADIETLQALMDDGSLTADDLVSAYLTRIEQYDQRGPALNAMQTLNPQARSQAQALDAERAERGARSSLHGIPVVVKDNYETQGMATQVGSKLFAQHAPQRDASQVAALKQAGAIILGKTTMHEFAYGITTVGSGFGATRNPYNIQRNPGGSSGGTGAAVAARFAVAGMGSDTCGSIRIPAAHNNLVGLRGTQGISSRYGIVPLSSTQDIGGPLARSVADLAILLDCTVGVDPQDGQTLDSIGQSVGDYREKLQPRTGIRVGLLTDWLRQEEADEPVATVIEQALSVMAAQADWHIQLVASPALNAALDRPLNGHYVLIHDFKTDIERYLRENPSLGYTGLEDMIARGLHADSVDGSLRASAAMDDAAQLTYWQEMAQRREVRRCLFGLMHVHQLDVLAYPTIRQVAAPLGDEQFGTNCRLSANSGLPAITVPAGLTADGMPVGLELLGPGWSEQLLLDLAHTVEQIYPQYRTPGFSS